MLSKEQIIDLLQRAAWTFLQAFLAVWIASSFELSKVAFVSAIAAGISAVKTFALTIVKDSK